MSKIIFDKKAEGQLLLRQIESGVSIWIEMLRGYAEEIENCLIKKIKQIKSSINSEDDIIEKEQMEMFLELYRASLFITCFTFFEFELRIICNTFYNRYELEKSLENYNKPRISLIENMVNYLKDICKLSLSPDSEYVKRIFIYNKLRNNIAHNAGRLVQNYDEVKSFISENDAKITINDYGLIIFTRDFIFDAIDTFNSFFENFYDAFYSWIDSTVK
ncbi:MAG: hypothetical protein ACLQBA_01345 [Candidatus Binataceae bacterium]